MKLLFLIRFLSVSLLMVLLFSCLPRKASVDRSTLEKGKGERIISLAPSITEILFELGAGGESVGVTESSNYPPEAKRITKVGGMDLDYEKIVSLKPTIVLLERGLYHDVIVRLRELKVPLLAFETKSVPELQENIAIISTAIGREEEGLKLNRELTRLLVEATEAAKNYGKPVKGLFLIFDNPYFGASPNSFVGDLLSAAGISNVLRPHPSGYPALEPERIIKLNPEVIFCSFKLRESEITRFKTNQAGKTGRIFEVDPDTYLRPTPRAVRGIQDLQELSGITPRD